MAKFDSAEIGDPLAAKRVADPYHEMNDVELRAAYIRWLDSVRAAHTYAGAVIAQQEVDKIDAEGMRRSIALICERS